MWLLLAFLLVPVIEIGLFIEIGGWLGLWPTLGIVVFTAFAGAAMVRGQGLHVMGEIRREMEAGRPPARAMAEGALLIVAGCLLLTPGFFTDAVGFALLVPAVRRAAVAWLASRVRFQNVHMDMGAHGSRPGGDVVDGEWEEAHRPDPDRKQLDER